MPRVKWFYCHKCKKTTRQAISTEVYLANSGHRVYVDVLFICEDCGRTLYRERKKIAVNVGENRGRI